MGFYASTKPTKKSRHANCAHIRDLGWVRQSNFIEICQLLLEISRIKLKAAILQQLSDPCDLNV